MDIYMDPVERARLELWVVECPTGSTRSEKRIVCQAHSEARGTLYPPVYKPRSLVLELAQGPHQDL